MTIWYQIFFWVSITIIVYTFLGYPVLISLLANYLRRPVKQARITPAVTLLIPAYNEAAVIADKIENSLALDYPGALLEIAVVTDGSDDETVQIVTNYRGQGLSLYHQPQRQGKVAAVNRIMPLIKSEIVIFSDANTMLEPDTLNAIVRNFADPAVGAVAGEKQVAGGGRRSLLAV